MRYWLRDLLDLVATGMGLGALGAQADNDNNTLIPNDERLDDCVVDRRDRLSRSHARL